ncbi:hypothetical protein RHABOEDO_001322 [Candidatus Rhabdochlamydia oedothoracis]|uniref:Uncharacterized protein n=1 Tax=Candidatus Rhabdochlamydia oedothoracis TaxID=2720720 RepID=A0ABX8V7R3_9BACT|nr:MULTISPECIES: hypothetical protein [Rhabdochlamydia]QYF49060.1 hypothetical protein RHABOEDO_001322 [Candidatus Rhabdochlamydia oedothoracis]
MIFNNQTQKETLPKGYHHLIYDQRYQIYILQARGDTSSSLVANLREIKGNEDTVISKLKKKHFLEPV